MTFQALRPEGEKEQGRRLIEDLQEVYEHFSAKDLSSDPIQRFQQDRKVFLGVDSKLESNVNFWSLRETILGVFGLKDAIILQVVGDSGLAFAEESIPRALKILSEQVKAETVLEYGYTAVRGDTNWLLGEYIQRLPEMRSRTIANIVQQSFECLQNQEWQGSSFIDRFVVLYKQGGSTKFGDDVWLSDGIMFADANDQMLCFEGGFQAFRQSVNMLSKGVKVMVITGLRPKDANVRFSAAQFLCFLKSADNAMVDIQAAEYLDMVVGGDGDRITAIQELLGSLLISAHDWRTLISIL